MHFCNVDVIKVKVSDGYRLFLQFDDGSEGEVDIAKLVPFKGVFEPLQNKAFFSRVTINSAIGTIFWENDADLSPNYLRKHIQPKK